MAHDSAILSYENWEYYFSLRWYRSQGKVTKLEIAAIITSMQNLNFKEDNLIGFKI